jgi:hypothetical protein
MRSTNNKFLSGFEKTALGKKTVERGVAAAFKRAGQKMPENVNYHGLEGLVSGSWGRLDEKSLTSAKYRLKAYQALFPKGKRMTEGKALRRGNLAASESPFDSLRSNEKLRKALNKKIEKTAGFPKWLHETPGSKAKIKGESKKGLKGMMKRRGVLVGAVGG